MQCSTWSIHGEYAPSSSHDFPLRRPTPIINIRANSVHLFHVEQSTYPRACTNIWHCQFAGWSHKFEIRGLMKWLE